MYLLKRSGGHATNENANIAEEVSSAHLEPRPRFSGAVARLVAFWSVYSGGLGKSDITAGRAWAHCCTVCAGATEGLAKGEWLAAVRGCSFEA